MSYLIVALAAALGALLVGLLGIGSSLLIMPTLALILPDLLDSPHALRIAAGTTMATMVAGAITASYTQFRNGNLDPVLLKLTFLPYLGGAMLGPWLSRLLPVDVLKLYLAGIILFVGIRMLIPKKNISSPVRHYRDHIIELCSVLFLVGICSSVAGIASGLFTIPYLTRYALPLRTIIGTSTAGAALYSSFGTIGYLTAGWSVDNLPAGCIGFVYLPAFLIMAVVSACLAPCGVHLAKYVNEGVLRHGFAFFLLFAALAIIFL